VFQDYANAAIANTTQNQVAWFQYGGDTYVVEHNSANGATSFANATDIIVKVAGQVDLTGAAFSTTTHALSI
jgi:S-layer protein